MELTRRNFALGTAAAAAGFAAAGALANGSGVRAANAAEASDEEVGTPEEVAAEPFTWDFTFEGVGTKAVEISRDGLVLRGRLEAPADVEKTGAPVVLFMHGARGNSRCDLYDTLCLHFARAGFAMLRFDFDGHGDSDGEFDDSTVLTELEDTAAIVAYAQALPWATDLAVIGHSQGGCVASMYAGQNPDAFTAVVTIDAAVNIYDNCSSGSLDGKASEAYIEAGKSLDIFGTAAGYEGPVCIIHGLADTVVLPEYAERLHEAMVGSDLHLITGMAHTPATHSTEIAGIVEPFLRRNLAI